MKKLLILSSVLFLINWKSKAQCDISQKSFTITPAVISVGQTASFKFTVMNEGTDLNCAYPIGSVAIVLSIPASGYSFQSFIAPVNGLGEYITWKYNATNQMVVGINHKAIPAGKGETDVTFKVIGVAGIEAATDLNIAILDGSSNLSTENDPASTLLKVSSNPLPVRLISFTGKTTALGNELSWKSNSEINFSHYEIEKSIDAKLFSKIGLVNGTSNSKENLSYSFIDKNYSSGMVPGATNFANTIESAYYRLKLVDLNGSTEYSKTIFITNEIDLTKVGEFYPNPSFDNKTSIKVNSKESSDLNISIYDISGKLIDTNLRKLYKGENNLTFELNGKYSGITIFRFENTEGVQYRKLSRQ